MVRVLVAGELNVDLVLHGYARFPAPGQEVLVDDMTLTLGSASAICAAGLAKLGDSVSFLAKVGHDAWGSYCVQRLRELGVDTSLIISDPGLKTGATISISSPRDRALVTYLGAIEALRAEDVVPRLEGFAHLHVSSFFLQRGLRPGLRELFRTARARGLTTSLDPGFDPQAQWSADLRDTLADVDVFLPNEVELREMTGISDVSEAIGSLENGRTLVVAKLGAEGCQAGARAVPGFRVEAVDTTGAGDSFNAGFLHAWLRRQPLEHCLRFASACGALSTLGMGGTEAQPTEEKASAFLETHYESLQP